MLLRRAGWILLLAGLLAFVPLASGSGQLKPGSLDPSFGTGGFATTNIRSSWPAVGPYYPSSPGEIELQPDGKIVAAGFVPVTSSRDAFAVARYGTTGRPDPTFGTDGMVSTSFASSARAYAVAIQPDARIVVLGLSASAGGGYEIVLVRYLPGGSLDTSFGTGGVVRTTAADLSGSAVGPWGVASVAVQPDGKIVVGFDAHNNADENDGFGLIRYNPDGSLDRSFGDGGVAATFIPLSTACGTDGDRDVAIQPDGKIVVLAWTVTTGGECIGGPSIVASTLVRYNPDGSLDQSFGHEGIAPGILGSTDAGGPLALALQPDGKIIIAGATEQGDGLALALERHNPDGSPDPGFGTNGIVWTSFKGEATAAAVTLQSDGKIIVAGSIGSGATSGKPSYDIVLARYNPDGTIDPWFGTGGRTRTSIGTTVGATAVALQPDGKIVTGGNVGASEDFVLARYFGGTAQCVVPKVRGRRIRRAKQAIRRADCAVGRVGRRFSSNLSKGRVLSQRPRAHTVHAAGTKVNLVVSKGKRPTGKMRTES